MSDGIVVLALLVALSAAAARRIDFWSVLAIAVLLIAIRFD